MKYLSESQTKSQLAAGRAVEQMLGHENHADYRILHWLRIEPERNGSYSVALFDVFDDGTPDYLDIYSFEPVDPDLAHGKIDSGKTMEQALDYCLQNYGAKANGWVGQGMIQDVYAELLKRHGVFER